MTVPPTAPTMPSTDILANLIPKIDPMMAGTLVLGFLFLVGLLIAGVLFLVAVKKNWIVLSWPYTVHLYKPAGNSILEFHDKAALIKDEKSKMMFRLQQGGFDFEIPDREYIRPGNVLYGWSSTMREFIPIKLVFEGYKNEPNPLVIRKIKEDLRTTDEQKRELLENYALKLKRMSLNFKPVVDTATINSTITNTADIVKKTPMKNDWLALLGVGIAVMIIIVSFMISAMLAMKQIDEGIKQMEVGKAQADALTAMADALNETNRVNTRLANLMERTNVLAVPQK